MGIGANIKKILDEKDIKQKEFASAIGETTVNISRYLNEQRKIPSELYSIISNFLKIDIGELLDTKFIPSKYIPLIGKSSCGKPKDYDLNGYDPVPVPLDIYKDGMYAVEADGDSMKPKINDGDIVYCQPNRIIDNGNIVHYWLNGESGIKKYKMNEAQTIISLIPINSDFEIITIHCDDKHELLMARVVGKFDKDF
jgi:repressor LexA